jgi:hypothetical protein
MRKQVEGPFFRWFQGDNLSYWSPVPSRGQNDPFPSHRPLYELGKLGLSFKHSRLNH